MGFKGGEGGEEAAHTNHWLNMQRTEDGKVEVLDYIASATFWGPRASTTASDLSATAKNGWVGGGRRGMKLSEGMGSHWLNMQRTEDGKVEVLDYIVCAFFWGRRAWWLENL